MSKLIIPHELLQPLATTRLAHLTKAGIDPKHLVQYSLGINELGDFRDIAVYLTKDIMEVYPDIHRHSSGYQTLLHSCIDCVHETGNQLLNIIQHVGGPGLTLKNLRFDRFIGDDLVVDITL